MKDINYGFREYRSSSNTHTHDYGQMIIPTLGELIVQTKTIETTVNHNKIMFLPPGSEHKYAAYSENRFLVLDIPSHFIAASDVEKNEGGKLILMNEKWHLVKRLMLEECKEQSPSSGLNNLFRYIYSDVFHGEEPISISYLKKHYDTSIRLEELAQIEGYAPNYYSEWFKKCTGQTVSDYIKSLRIGKAKELLITTSYSLAQIAQLVGYEHHSSLTRAFKCNVSLSPADFRKLHSKN